jgi:hypothetical protein
MLNRSAKTASYDRLVAKIGITIPGDLLAHVDDYAARAGETREVFLGRIVEEEVDRLHAGLREELEELLDGVEFDLGGKTAAEWIRHDRDHRDDKRWGPDGHAR